MNIALALASATLVAAQRNNGSVIVDTPKPNNPGGNSDAAAVGNGQGFPGRIGTFELYGCVKHDSNWPGWRRISSLPEMDLNFCAASCEEKYFGVSDT